MNIIKQSGFLVLVLALPFGAVADQQMVRKDHDKTWTGALSALDTHANTVQGKTWWRTRTFNLGKDCAISAVDKNAAALSDLRPGVEVRIRYQNVNGVLVADQVVEMALHYAGTVGAVDPKAGTLTMAEAPLYQPFHAPRTFRIADDCKVFLNQGDRGAPANLQPGDRVTVVYELPGGSPVAYRIRERTATFVGAVNAIDLSARTVVAKDMSAEKRFELANHCQVLVRGRRAGDLRQVVPGQRYQFTYEEVNGVNVLDRIAPVQPTPSTETASTR